MTTIVINNENKYSYIDKISVAIDNLHRMRVEGDIRTMSLYKAQFPQVKEFGWWAALTGTKAEILYAEDAPLNLYLIGGMLLTDTDYENIDTFWTKDFCRVYPSQSHNNLSLELQKLLSVISKHDFVQADVEIDLIHKIQNKGI